MKFSIIAIASVLASVMAMPTEDVKHPEYRQGFGEAGQQQRPKVRLFSLFGHKHD